MGTMTDETYNGYANRETWAFNLHWQNDQGLYYDTLNMARDILDEDAEISDSGLGEKVAEYWTLVMDEYEEDHEGDSAGEYATKLRMFRREVGSWWRLDYAEVGAAVRESLDAEAGE